MLNKLKLIILLLSLEKVLTGCQNPEPNKNIDTNTESGTPVTLTTISVGPISEKIELNATSAFLLKTNIKSTATGYLQAVYAKPGGLVQKGSDVFIIKTKEAEALGNTINILDSSFRFTGIIHVKAPGTGYVTTLNYRKGDYVTDGEQLASISDESSFCFLMDLPYEMKFLLSFNKSVIINLPDGTKMNGFIDGQMPTVDLVLQTQTIVIKVHQVPQVPEGLIARVVLTKASNLNAKKILKEAVLANETQTEFWVMKLINSNTAIKIPVAKGVENSTMIEIISPRISINDSILVTGNYGLPDTATVLIKR